MSTKPQTAQDIRVTWLADGWLPLCRIDYDEGSTEHWAKYGLRRILTYPGGPYPEKVKATECTIGIWHETEAAADLLDALKKTVEELAHCAVVVGEPMYATVRKDYRAKLENICHRAFAAIAKATRQEE